MIKAAILPEKDQSTAKCKTKKHRYTRNASTAEIYRVAWGVVTIKRLTCALYFASTQPPYDYHRGKGNDLSCTTTSKSNLLISIPNANTKSSRSEPQTFGKKKTNLKRSYRPHWEFSSSPKN